MRALRHLSGGRRRDRARGADPRGAGEMRAPPAARPLRSWRAVELRSRLQAALEEGDGPAGAHCIHELWMRTELGFDFDSALEALWKRAASSIPEWLPMTYIDWLPVAYDIAGRFQASRKGRSNLYLALLDYRDRRGGPFGVYVGMSDYTPAQRFDQHKAGIRASGSVLKRGLEVLTGPVMHLQRISRAQAAQIEADLAAALEEAGLLVQGGH